MKAETALDRALVALFAGRGAMTIIEHSVSRPWTSATFAGTRHEVELRVAGADAAKAVRTALADLGDREFDLPGHILVDIATAGVSTDGDNRLVTIEALTVVAD